MEGGSSQRGRTLLAGTLMLPFLLAACSGSGGKAAVQAAASPVGRCEATPVQYKPYRGVQAGLAPYRWIAASPVSSALLGHLFYYDRDNPWRRKRLARLRIYAGGQSPDGRESMKILWELRRGSAIALRVQGTRLDASGSFSQELSPAGAAQFPSIINVPTRGCWRLTLRAGKVTGHVTLLALPEKTN
jgi:hypothetical protein